MAWLDWLWPRFISLAKSQQTSWTAEPTSSVGCLPQHHRGRPSPIAVCRIQRRSDACCRTHTQPHRTTQAATQDPTSSDSHRVCASRTDSLRSNNRRRSPNHSGTRRKRLVEGHLPIDSSNGSVVSRDSSFQRIATPTHIAEIDSAEYFDPTPHGVEDGTSSSPTLPLPRLTHRNEDRRYHAKSKLRMVPVLVANLSIGRPIRCSMLR